jgi:hypothetical protein
MTGVAILLFAIVSISLRMAIYSTRANRRDDRYRGVPSEPPPPRPCAHALLETVDEGELVKLVGRARGTPIKSALTGRACVAYLSRAQVWHSRKIPQLIEDLRDAKGTFVLEVADGEILVEGTFVIEMRTARVSPAPELGHALLAAHKLERFAPSSDFEEALIEDGTTVAVIGVVVRDAVEAAGYRELPRQRRRFVAHERHPVTVVAPP